ncbi:hypothetical protein HanXRQr2_Chr14g0631611 [Helianthus annuus]|uniref:Uncharacterized protein n=1 Tax=Helianthus annuus TaxID=4232 RepID=A0A9K3E6S3_HELAN|nr:hypothetical protein HanXRQr2_Chr14g0631611 [Helianthus annuus]
MAGVLQNVNIKQRAGFIPVGLWGKQSGDPQNEWSFELDQGQRLKKITIDHGDDVIYSLMRTHTTLRNVIMEALVRNRWSFKLEPTYHGRLTRTRK